MADALFEDRRLVELYDPLESDRRDLNAYLSMADEFAARSVLDVGCGTGTFACLLAQRGLDVTAVDPAPASLEVARRKRGAERVRWIIGDVTAPPHLQVDMATMTGNVAQVFVGDAAWASTLGGVRKALEESGRLVFETRDPAARGWDRWTRDESERRLTVPGTGAVMTWTELLDVDLPLVSFRVTFVFENDGTTLHSDSTLRFRDMDDIERSLADAGFAIEELRDAADRPGLEFVVIARPCREGG